MLYVTLFVTAAYTYAPFSTLIWYREGVPHNSVTEHEYEVVCPDWLGDNLTEIRRVQSKVIDSEYGAQYYMQLDKSCNTAVNWCNDHPEIQGKYIDRSPNFLTYDEFEVCYAFFEDQILGSRYILWSETGGSCDPFNPTSCPKSGACGLKSLSGANDTLFEEDYICCHSGNAVSFESTRYQDAGHTAFYDQYGNTVCDDQPLGQPCTDNTMCENGAVCERNVCVLLPELENTTGWLGAPCGRKNSVCQSGFCWNGTCQHEPTICPREGLEAFGGLKLDPFCRTYDDWCQYTNLFEFQTAFKAVLGVTLVSRNICEQVLNKTIEFGLVRILNESDADIGYNYTYYNHDDVEEVLVKEWTILILFSIAVVGFFALLAILRKICSSNSDDRPRDYKIKCAASSKITNVIENAISLHTQGVRGKGRVMVRTEVLLI